jgi:hypothetical protein
LFDFLVFFSVFSVPVPLAADVFLPLFASVFAENYLIDF